VKTKRYGNSTPQMASRREVNRTRRSGSRRTEGWHSGYRTAIPAALSSSLLENTASRGCRVTHAATSRIVPTIPADT